MTWANISLERLRDADASGASCPKRGDAERILRGTRAHREQGVAVVLAVHGVETRVSAFVVVPIAKHPALRAVSASLQAEAVTVGEETVVCKVADLNGLQAIEPGSHTVFSLPIHSVVVGGRR